jgi:UDP-3-O-[3-hydroxymyristoyl] glucosamine N-acyltransferase
MEFTARKIAELLNGTVEGNTEVSVNYVSKIEDGKPGTISFLANPKYKAYIYDTRASIVLVNKDFEAEKEISCTLIRVDNAYMAFAKLLEIYQKIRGDKKGISEKASIAESASIGEDNYIGDFSFIGDNVTTAKGVKIFPQVYLGENVRIGENTIIYPGVKVYSDCIIGANVRIHAGCIIGADGFGFAPQDGSDYQKIAQIGNVIIEDNVEIGANTTIDRATLGSTIIKKGVKLDNLIQIAHNVVVGENTVIAAQTGISGSSVVGSNNMIGGQVGFAGHIKTGNKVNIAAQSGLSNNVKDNTTVMGSPAFNISDYRRTIIHFKNLDKHIRNLNTLVKKYLKEGK